MPIGPDLFVFFLHIVYHSSDKCSVRCSDAPELGCIDVDQAVKSSLAVVDAVYAAIPAHMHGICTRPDIRAVPDRIHAAGPLLLDAKPILILLFPVPDAHFLEKDVGCVVDAAPIARERSLFGEEVVELLVLNLAPVAVRSGNGSQERRLRDTVSAEGSADLAADRVAHVVDGDRVRSLSRETHR